MRLRLRVGMYGRGGSMVSFCARVPNSSGHSACAYFVLFQFFRVDEWWACVLRGLMCAGAESGRQLCVPSGEHQACGGP